MIKVSFHKIIMKKSRIWPFVTLGLAELGQLTESMTQKHKNRILQWSFKQLSNYLMKTKLGSDTTDGF